MSIMSFLGESAFSTFHRPFSWQKPSKTCGVPRRAPPEELLRTSFVRFWEARVKGEAFVYLGTLLRGDAEPGNDLDRLFLSSIIKNGAR